MALLKELQMQNEPNIHERLAMLLESACNQFEVLLKLLSDKIVILDKSQSAHIFAGSLAKHVIEMALAKEFLFNARRVHRLVDQGKGPLGLDRKIRRNLMSTLKPIIGVRDANEHGFDEKPMSGKPIPKPRPHYHFGGAVSVDETSLMVIGSKILMGPLDLRQIYNAVAILRNSAGYKSLKNHGESYGLP